MDLFQLHNLIIIRMVYELSKIGNLTLTTNSFPYVHLDHFPILFPINLNINLFFDAVLFIVDKTVNAGKTTFL